MNKQKQFTDFLKRSVSQKEVSLAIAKDNDEVAAFQDQLDRAEFRQAIDVSEIIKRNTASTKVYFIVRNKLQKDVYDFLTQYPTGQVEIFDKDKMSSLIFSPSYKNTSIIFILTKKTLQDIQKGGFQLLGYAGMSYQS